MHMQAVSDAQRDSRGREALAWPVRRMKLLLCREQADGFVDVFNKECLRAVHHQNYLTIHVFLMFQA